MANAYFTLEDSIGYTKKFGVLSGAYFPSKSKAQNIGTTLNGRLDVATGGIYERHTYTIRTLRGITDPRDGYGNYADLDYFYSLNNPNGSPSNILTFTDHYEQISQVIMNGDFSPQPLGVSIEGATAWFVVQCTFVFIPATVVGSGS